MRVIILAAGHGKRMGHELPKPLVPLCGQPMIQYLLDAIKESGVCDDPILVVSPGNKHIFEEILGGNFTYALQEEQLGTGHATAAAKSLLTVADDLIMVLYGDAPWVSAETLKAVAKRAEETKSVLTMATTIVPDFEAWRQAFFAFGRIIRDKNNNVTKIVEKKDATNGQISIKEVNPAYMCFKADWLWDRLTKIKNDNAQEEYYLTDLVKIAFEEGEKIATVQIDPKEALGINTKEHLELCEQVAKQKNLNWN